MLVEVCATWGEISKGFRKVSGTFLTVSSICEVPLGARTEVKGTDGSRFAAAEIDKEGGAGDEGRSRQACF